MEERELTQLLQRLGDRVTPGPAPVGRIVAAGEALRGRRSGRVKVFAAAAAVAAVVGGGSVAAVVLDLPSGSSQSADSAAGGAADGAGGESGGVSSGAGEAPPRAGSGAGTDDGVAAADSVDALVVAPDVVAPGGTVAVTPRLDVSSFGLVWRLVRLTDAGWTWEYTLRSARGASAPAWGPAEKPGSGDDVLVPYSRPITLVIPPVAAPGDYRICQSYNTQDLCGRFTVAD
jgi:hypothetical protein